MPSLLPQASLSTAIEVNSRQDLAIASVPVFHALERHWMPKDRLMEVAAEP